MTGCGMVLERYPGADCDPYGEVIAAGTGYASELPPIQKRKFRGRDFCYPVLGRLLRKSYSFRQIVLFSASIH